jgi:hypothetical protein
VWHDMTLKLEGREPTRENAEEHAAWGLALLAQSAMICHLGNSGITSGSRALASVPVACFNTL